MSDFARWCVAAEMLLLLFTLVAVVALEDTAARRSPREWRWALAAVALVIGSVCAAVILNAFIGGEQTPGVKFLAYVAAGADLLALVGVWKALRTRPSSEAELREQHVVANAPLLAEALSHFQHLEPCPDPNCMRIRRELMTLAGDTP